MSMCACARSLSYCEIKGCKSRGDGYYSKPSCSKCGHSDSPPPWEPRYVARATGPDEMVLVDTAMKRVKTPLFTEQEIGWNVGVTRDTRVQSMRTEVWVEDGKTLGRVVSPPAKPEVVVAALFEWNRQGSGYREIEHWGEAEAA